MLLDAVIALLEARIAHCEAEANRNKRSGYAECMRWRKMEAQHILAKIKELESKP